MRHCILHIGQPKTGSTSIQETLHSHRESLLADHSIGYFGGTVRHWFLTDALKDASEPMTDHVAKRAGASDSAQRELVRELQSDFEHYLDTSGATTEIISSENIQSLQAPQTKRLYAWLKLRFDSIHVIAYVRPALEGLSSRAQQALKKGETFESIRALIPCRPRADKDAHINRIVPPMKLIYEPFQDNFGSDNVTFRHFSRSRLHGGDVVEDFTLTTLGRSCDALGISKVQTNQALSATAAYALEAINRAAPPLDSRSAAYRNGNRARALLKPLQAYPCQRKFMLPDVDWDHIRRVVHDDTVWLYETTAGAIDFRHEATPQVQPEDQLQWTPELEYMTLLWHHDKHIAEQESAKHAIERILNRLSRTPADCDSTLLENLRKQLQRVTDADTLERSARRLWRMGIDTAARDAAMALRWLSSDAKIQARGEHLLSRPGGRNPKGQVNRAGQPAPEGAATDAPRQSLNHDAQHNCPACGH